MMSVPNLVEIFIDYLANLKNFAGFELTFQKCIVKILSKKLERMGLQLTVWGIYVR